MFKDKVLMITGGTGSFGHAVLKKFLETDVREIRIFSRDEKKQEDMRLAFRNSKLKFYLGDVRSYESVQDAMKGVNYVFHAAALKQVPSCEFYPMEAIRTNVLGAENVINAAIANRVERVVALSTDKAVYPINAMGMSKALMEKLVVAKARTLEDGETVLCSTRYGNVMASRGSVIPLFVGQLKQGDDITITDPSMTRFLMYLDDSFELVLSTVEVLAIALKELFQGDSTIRIIGTRHGEKLYESLVSREEMAKAEDVGSYFRIPADNRDLNYNLYFTEGETAIAKLSDYTSHNTERLNVEGVKQLLLKLDFIQEQLNA